MTRCLGLAAIVGVLMCTSAALAQEDSDERARLHFESGRSYFDEGAYERALQEFERAYELSPRVAMLFNLGTTYERLGRLGEAADAFEGYLEGTPDAQNRATLTRRIANLRRRAASQESGSSEGSETTETTTTTTTSTQTTTDAPPSSGGGGGGDGLLIGGIAALSVAGVGLAMTGIFGGLTLSEQGTIEDGCGATASCSEDQISDLRTFATVTDVSWIVAAVAGATGVVLLALGLTAGGDDSQASIRFNGTGVEGTF